MKDVYVVMYTNPLTSHSFVKSIHAKRERAEATVIRDNFVQYDRDDRCSGGAYSTGYFAHIVVAKLEDY